MKKFIKQNWFKIFIVAILLVVSLSIAYYFIIYLPKERVEKEGLVNQIKCQQSGIELYKAQLKEVNSDGSLGNPEFKFNKDLKICLYKNVIISAYSNIYFVIDVYTNKELASWTQVKSQKTGQWEDLTGSEVKWKIEVYRLFGK